MKGYCINFPLCLQYSSLIELKRCLDLFALYDSSDSFGFYGTAAKDFYFFLKFYSPLWPFRKSGRSFLFSFPRDDDRFRRSPLLLSLQWAKRSSPLCAETNTSEKYKVLGRPLRNGNPPTFIFKCSSPDLFLVKGSRYSRCLKILDLLKRKNETNDADAAAFFFSGLNISSSPFPPPLSPSNKTCELFQSLYCFERKCNSSPWVPR